MAIDTHRGNCNCVRVAFHLYDGARAWHGISYTKEGARFQQKVLAKSGIPVVIEEKPIYTIARHIDEDGKPA